MSFFKYAASAAAMVGVASAASCSFQATTISAAGDVSSIAACSTISGNVVFATGAAAPTLALTSVKEIDGDLTYDSDNTITSFQAPMLKKVSGKILLNNLQNLHDVNWNAIEQTGNVSITNCASLAQVVTGTQYATAGTLELSNTYLSTMGGFGNLTKIDALSISGNPLLADITMNINSVNSIDIGSNEEANQGLAVQFDNLTMALDHITVQNATNVSFASLQMVANNLALISNNFDTFSAPKLVSAGGLVLNSNPNLNNISLPMLQALNGSTGTFQIANNSALQTIGGYPMLSDCEHDVIFRGNFKDAELDNFKKIAGAIYVYSTQDISKVCSTVNTLAKNQIVRGKPNCKSADPTASGATGTKSGGTSGSASSSSAAAVPINIPALPALSAGLGAALLQFFLSF